MSLQCADLAMYPAFCFNIGSVSFFRSAEVSKVVSLTHDRNLRSPFSVVSSYAKKSAAVVASGFALILSVFRGRNKAKVGYPVVIWVAVDMVNLQYRPLTVDIKPRKSMRSVILASNHNLHIPLAVLASGVRAFFGCTGPSLRPSKHTSFGVI